MKQATLKKKRVGFYCFKIKNYASKIKKIEKGLLRKIHVSSRKITSLL